MAEPAAVPSGGINPNIPVGDEPTIRNRSNSSTSFDDVDDAMNSPQNKPKKPAAVKEAPKPKDKEDGDDKPNPRVSGAKAKPDLFEDAEDDKPAKKDVKEKKDRLADDDDDRLTKEKDAQRPKAKLHKLKRGDDEAWDIPSDAMVTVTVDGKPVEMEFQEAINRVSGETNYRDKTAKLGDERKQFETQRDGMNTMVSDLYARVQKDPDAALDFLADLTKQDPIALKEGMLRKQIDQFKALRDMSDDDVETWIKDQVRDWRDKHYNSRIENEKQRETKRAAEAERQQVVERFGIDDARYGRAEKMVKDFFTKNQKDYDGTVTSEQIVHADRHMMALEAIHEAVPHLENNPNYDKIVSDIVPDLIRNPATTRSQLAKTLVEVFGEDKEGLKKLGRKASENAKAATDQRPRKDPSRDPISFDEID